MKLTHLPKQLVILSFVLSLLVTPLATLLLTPQTAQAVENGKIVYTVVVDDSSQIYVMDPDGSNKLQLSSGHAGGYPSIARDGSKVVYMHFADESTFYLATTNTDGAENVITSTPGYYPGWLPSSTKIFYPDPASSFEIFTMSIDETNKESTGFTPGVFEGPVGGAIDFSPDSMRFAYPVIDDSDFKIAIADIDGSNNMVVSSVGLGLSPSYTPDGNSVYFVGSPDDGATIYVYSVSVDGSNETQHQELPSGSSLHSFRLSPDGTKAFFVTGGDTTYDLYTMNADGSNQILIADEIAGFDESSSVSWSPDSAKLVFSSGSGDSDQDVFSINVDGTGLINLTNTPGQSEFIVYTWQAWAPVPGTLDDDEDSEAGSGSTLTTNLPTTNKASYLVLPSSTSNASFTPTPASSVPTDSNGQYSYPTDLVSFQFDTESPGDTETITLYFDLPGDPSTYTARKYNDITKEFSSIPNASITREDYNNTNMLKLTYQITDGGLLDQDNTTNGTIVDPVGLATTTGSPNTGLQTHWLLNLN